MSHLAAWLSPLLNLTLFYLFYIKMYGRSNIFLFFLESFATVCNTFSIFLNIFYQKKFLNLPRFLLCLFVFFSFALLIDRSSIHSVGYELVAKRVLQLQLFWVILLECGLCLCMYECIAGCFPLECVSFCSIFFLDVLVWLLRC